MSLSKETFEEAWICLLGLYGRSFEAQYGSIDGEQFKLWFAGLASNGVTDKMVGEAINAIPAVHAAKSSHPPNFADLLQLCAGGARNDALDEDRAFNEANAAARAWSRHCWSSPATYHAAVAVGSWSLRQFPEKITRQKFVEAYRKLLDRERAGESLPAPPEPAGEIRGQVAAADPNTAKQRREVMASLSRAILELPPSLQRSATEALKSGTRLAPLDLLPIGTVVSRSARAILLEHCCESSTFKDSAQCTDDPAEAPNAFDGFSAPPSI